MCTHATCSAMLLELATRLEKWLDGLELISSRCKRARQACAAGSTAGPTATGEVAAGEAGEVCAPSVCCMCMLCVCARVLCVYVRGCACWERTRCRKFSMCLALVSNVNSRPPLLSARFLWGNGLFWRPQNAVNSRGLWAAFQM